MAADARTQDWWAIHDPMQAPLSTRKAGEWWAIAEEVFHLEASARLAGSALSACGNLRSASTLQFALQLLAFPTWMRNGGRNDSGNEPMRFNRSILGSSDRRM